MQDVEVLGHGAIFVLLISFVLVIALMAGLLWFGWWVSKKKGSMSPYSKVPMLLGTDVVPSIRRYVNDFLLSHPQPENSPIEFDTASICSETGRIFPNSVFRGMFVKLDWTFLQKGHPGNYVSWGSLSELEQATIKLCHDSLAGYQTEDSSPNSRPQAIDSHYATLKPGPLYVDRLSRVLLGWKEVPGTEFEVLIFQRPIHDSVDDTL